MTGYQPEWIDGQEVGVGWRDAAGRYDAIKRYLVGRQARTDLRQFVHPTVIEIGAYNGYFCHRLHDDFDAQCLAVDGGSTLVPRPGTNVLHQVITPEEILGLGSFDISLCLSVLHHHPNWADYLQSLLDVSVVAFIEIAHPDEPLDNNAKAFAFGAARALKTLGGDVLVETPPMNVDRPLRPLYVFDKGESFGAKSIGGTS